jgi:SAM-dependent methyltransferase
MGQVVQGVQNENLEAQTFSDQTFDLVLHLDVLEHLFNPFAALQEIARTLKPHGICLFTVPVERGRLDSEQVAFEKDGELIIVGAPEYHGNPQRPDDGTLVTWRYGEDLPLQISRHAELDVEHRRFQCEGTAVMGYMDDVFILRKRVGVKSYRAGN